MKKITFTLLILLVLNQVAYSQTTHIPDSNFENYLETHRADGAAVVIGDPASMGNGILNDNLVTTSKINTVLYLDVNTLNISDLTGIEDFTALITLRCFNNAITALDLSQNTALTELYCSNNQLTSLDMSQNPALIFLNCNDNELTNLNVSQNPALISLNCRNNELNDLNVSQNSNLTSLICRNNQLSNLNVSQNLALTTLSCYENQLTSLDLSQNTALTFLNCRDNELLSLNVKNGNNTNFTSFNAKNNPNLGCIIVDDVTWSNSNWTDIDAISTFISNQADCNLLFTFVPDDNFENYLETHRADGATVVIGDPDSMGNGILNDNLVTTSKINTVLYLDVNTSNISDLTGIEDFTALTSLICNNNQLTALNITQNTALTNLICNTNQLSNLDLSQNMALTSLICNSNQLNNLNLSQNTALTSLICNNNQLSNLNLSQNTALTSLICDFNQLSNLNLSQNTALTNLICSVNQLTTLDLSQNTSLTTLVSSVNQLTTLNVKNGNNTNITNFITTNNPNLTCIEVDDAAYSTTNWTNIDPQTSFSEDCSDTNCNNAQPITVSSTINTVNFNLIDEPINNEEGCSGIIDDYADTWFEFVLESDGAVGINGSVNVNRFALYDACEGTEIACFNNFGIIENLTNGTTYKLRVFRTAATASNSNFTSFDIIFDDTLNTEDFTSSKVSVALYPNPSSDIVTITSNVTEKIGTISIIDVSGKKLMSQNDSNVIYVRHLANGMYFITIEVGTQIITKKLLIKK